MFSAKFTCEEIVDMFFKSSKVRDKDKGFRKISLVCFKLKRAVKKAREKNEDLKKCIKDFFGEQDWTPNVERKTPSTSSSPSIGTEQETLSKILWKELY